MAKIKVFAVFHKILDERKIFGAFEENEIQQWFVKYGVNERHQQKQVVCRDGRIEICLTSNAGTILEYQLEKYFPELQARGFMETSCFVHVEANRLFGDADLIGTCQYDMQWTAAAVSLLRHLSGLPTSGKIAYGLSVGPIISQQGYIHPYTFADRRNWPFLMESYNRFFGTSWNLEILVDKPLTLFQTYVLPRDEFLDLARWLKELCSEVYPWATQPPYETHWGSLGGYTERAESLFIAARIHEQRLILENLPLCHDPEISRSLGVKKEHYGN
jgi:hypothetical protein